MTSPFLKLFNLSFCIIWLGSMWCQLFQVTWSIFELLVKLTLDHFFGIVMNTSCQDTIPSKQQWQGLMCFNSECHWENSRPSKVCDIYLCTYVAPFWTLYWQTLCLKTENVQGNDNDDFCSFVLNCLYNEGSSKVLISLWVVACSVFLAFAGMMPIFYLRL